MISLHTIWKKGLNRNSQILTLASEILASERKAWVPGRTAKGYVRRDYTQGLANESKYSLTFAQLHRNR